MTHFQTGDIVRCIEADSFGRLKPERGVPGQTYVVARISAGIILADTGAECAAHRFVLAARQGADGWYEWKGGENPVPGRMVRVRLRDVGGRLGDTHPSERWAWGAHDGGRGDIVAFQLVTEQPAPTYRKGDMVHIRVTVERDGPDSRGVYARSAAGEDAEGYVSASEIVHVETRPLAVGDRVRVADGTTPTILAIHETYAWTVRDGRPPLSFSLSQLERLP